MALSASAGSIWLLLGQVITVKKCFQQLQLSKGEGRVSPPGKPRRPADARPMVRNPEEAGDGDMMDVITASGAAVAVDTAGVVLTLILRLL